MNSLMLGSNKKIKGGILLTCAVALIVSGFFAPNFALAAATVNPASGGIDISIDTTSAPGGSETYKTLIGPSFGTENGDIAIGTHTISLPSGWEFDTGSTIIIIQANDITLVSTSITPDVTSFTFEVTGQSTSAGAIIFSNLKVRPTGDTPSTDDMTYSGTGIAGVDGTTNFGTLSTVAGVVTQLAFTTQPGNATYGSNLSPQPVIRTQDQFGNDSTSGLDISKMVTLTLTAGSGVLHGTDSLDIGTGVGNGIASFTDLTVDEFGIDKILTASATGLASDVSANFEITKKSLTATVDVDDKTYDGDNSAAITDVHLEGVVIDDAVTPDFALASATFVSANVGTYSISVTGVTLTGADALNYTLTDGDIIGTGTINPLEITITPTAGQSKIYGAFDPVFDYTPDPLIGSDTFTNSLSRDTGENVGSTYAYTLGTLTAGSNYTLVLVSETFEITKRTLNVTAAGDDKVYNATTDATVTLSDDRIGGDDITLGYTAVFTDKNVNTGITVNISAISITGTTAGNYTLGNVPTNTTAEITPKQLTVTFTTDVNKIYNGNANAPITGRTLDGVIGSEVVGVTSGSATFADKHIGNNKTVTATGFTLTGADAGNYTIGAINSTTGNVSPRPITITAVTDSKTYDGTIGSDETSTITSTFSPPIAVSDTANFTQTYDNKNVGTGKTLTPSGTVDDDNGGANYIYTFVPDTTGVITKKSINVTPQSDTKTYDGTTNSSIVPVADTLETGDTVGTPPTQSYDTKDIGTDKILTASGLGITGGNDNYDINYVNDVTGVITAKNLTVSDASTNSKTYDGGVIATVDFEFASLIGKVGSEDVTLDSSGYSATFDNKDVATGKTVTVSGLVLAGTGEGNYSLTQPILNDGVIVVRPITVTAVTDTKVYDGNTTSAAIPTITDGSLASGDTADFTQSYNIENVGIGKTLMPIGIVNDGNGGNNYDVAFVNDTTGEITKAPLTITADAKSKVYGAANPALTASYVGFVNVENESVLDIPVVLTTLADETSPVDAYEITASGATDANYNISFVSGTLAVTQALLTVTVDGEQSKTYGDADPAFLTYGFSGLVNGDTEAVFSGTLVRVAGEFAGAYNINQDTLLAGGNYSIIFNGGVFTIEQRGLTVTAVTDTKTYDGTLDSIGVPTFTGELQFGDTADFTQSYDTAGVGDTKVLTAGGLVNDGSGGANYSYDFLNTAVGEITQLGITITPDAGQNKIYDNADPVSFTHTNLPALIGGDLFSGDLSRVAGENVGTYVYTLGTLSASGNYDLILVAGTFEIIKATPVLAWGNPADIVYGTALSGTQLNATADVGGVFVYTPALGTVLNAGVNQTLSATFTPADNANYNSVTPEVSITVTPAPLTVTADSKLKEYGDADPALTFTFSGLVNDDTVAVFTGSLERVAGEFAGAYNINQGTLSAGGNYAIAYTPETFIIEDTVAPTIISHIPSVNVVNVAVGNSIAITFNEEVVAGVGNITLSPATDFTISGSGTDVITLTPISVWDDNTIYTVTVTINVADVNGVNLEGEYSWSFTTATQYSVSLNSGSGGWNLISLPVVPTNKNISAVLGGLESSIAAVWTYDPTNLNAVEGWLVYVPGNPAGTNNLDIMTAGYGYWIDATADADISGSGGLLTAGPTAPPSRNLTTGWNLVGYYQIPGENFSAPENAFASLGGIAGLSALWGFDNSTGGFISVTTILPGDAFWISLPSVKVYTPSNISE